MVWSNTGNKDNEKTDFYVGIKGRFVCKEMAEMVTLSKDNVRTLVLNLWSHLTCLHSSIVIFIVDSFLFLFFFMDISIYFTFFVG